MKRTILCAALTLAAGSLLAADSTLKDDLSGAAKKLAKNSYSWKTTREFGNFNNTSDGKTDKDGTVWLSLTFGDNTTEAFLKEGKGAVKRPDEDWKSLEEINAAQAEGRGRFLGRMLQNYKTPAVEAADILEKTKELKKDGDACGSDLTEEGAKNLLTFGGRRPPNAPEPKNAKASVKFWLKDGQLTKYEYKVQGTVSFNNEERDIDGTTTVEIKDIGATKLAVPEEAKKKLL
jgi:hypothetical protein